MKELLSDFVTGGSSEKLAIISNISTILGVSVVTFVAGPFLSEFVGKEFIVSDFIISIIFYFLCIWFVLALFYSGSKEVYIYIKSKKPGKATSHFLLQLLIFWVCIVLFPYFKYLTGNLFNVSYMLSPPASSAIAKISNVSITKEGETSTIIGKVEFLKNIVSSDYVVLVYSKNDSGIYNSILLTNSEYVFRINHNGNFSLPISNRYNSLSNIYLSFFRSSDWSLLNMFNANNGGYPSAMISMPNSDLDKLKAVIYKVKG